MVGKEERRVLVHEEPTTMHGSPARVTISQTFVLNNRHRYIWKVIGISDVDKHYITYIAHGENTSGWVNIVVRREWSVRVEDNDKRR
jgi:hypothetical protein